MPIQVVASLPPPPNPANLGGVPLAFWACTAFYVRNYGLRQAPVCGPVGTPSSIQRVHAPVGKKVIKWVAIGWGAKPPLPSADTGSANEVLEGDLIGQPAAGKWVDGQDVVAVYGEYHYLLQLCPSASDLLTFVAAPYQSAPNVAVYQLSPADFSRIFTGPSATPSGFGGQLIGY